VPTAERALVDGPADRTLRLQCVATLCAILLGDLAAWPSCSGLLACATTETKAISQGNKRYRNRSDGQLGVDSGRWVPSARGQGTPALMRDCLWSSGPAFQGGSQPPGSQTNERLHRAQGQTKRRHNFRVCFILKEGPAQTSA
jgi:hypothetical protein